MKIAGAHINLILAWLWILLGFLSGMVLGLFFHRESWLGGYASFKRMLRAGKILHGTSAKTNIYWSHEYYSLLSRRRIL